MRAVAHPDPTPLDPTPRVTVGAASPGAPDRCFDRNMAVLQLDDWPPDPIRTERLVVRTSQESDRDGFIALLTSPAARRFLGGPIAPADVVTATTGPYRQTPGSFVMALRASDAFLGTIGLDRRDADRPGHLHQGGLELELSYALDPAHWGQGYATEAVAAVLAWASVALTDSYVVACTQIANTASTDLLQRLGFGRVGAGFVEFHAEQSLWSRPLTAQENP
jgi:RimJ/RimL family protein N-acetyltransferase